jgi:hypothetical protein
MFSLDSWSGIGGRRRYKRAQEQPVWEARPAVREQLLWCRKALTPSGRLAAYSSSGRRRNEYRRSPGGRLLVIHSWKSG